MKDEERKFIMVDDEAEELKFMVLDDYLKMTQMVRTALSRLGYRYCITETDPRRAVHRMKEEGVGFLISDWSMPHKSGVDIVKEMKADPQLKDIPILMISGEAGREEVIQAIKAGIDNYILKPFSPQELGEKVKSILQKRGMLNG